MKLKSTSSSSSNFEVNSSFITNSLYLNDNFQVWEETCRGFKKERMLGFRPSEPGSIPILLRLSCGGIYEYGQSSQVCRSENNKKHFETSVQKTVNNKMETMKESNINMVSSKYFSLLIFY